MTPAAIEDELDQLAAWLDRDGFTVEAVEDPQTHRTLEAERGQDFTYSLVHPDPEADHVFVGLALPGDPLADAFGEASQEEAEAYLTDLRFGLLGMGVEFEGLEVPTEQVSLFLPAYFDGLSKDRFMEKLRKVKNAGLFLQWSLGPMDAKPAGGPDGGDRYIR